MKDLYEIIESLKNEPKTTKKLEILEENKKNEDLRLYFFYSLNNMKYGIKRDIPFQNKEEKYSLKDCYDLLERLSRREITGNKALDCLKEILEHLSPKNSEIFRNMYEKNPRCGLSSILINRVFENLIPLEIKLMKAFPFSEKSMENISYPAFSQRKCDGARCLAFKIGNEVILKSSGAYEYANLESLKQEIQEIQGDFVLDGELLVLENNMPLPRKEGNGILNKAIHGTITREEAEKVNFVTWDMVSLEDYEKGKGSIRYKEVLKNLKETLKNKKRISLVETKEVKNKKEALEHFHELLRRGEEGTILKNENLKWEGKRSKNCVKFKIVMQSTLKIYDFQEGVEKYTGCLGALLCSSEDEKVKVKVGSGFSDEQRKKFWEIRETLRGKTIEIESNGIIENPEGYSLFLPRFIELRDKEKTEADDFQTIKELSAGSFLLTNF